MSNQLSQVSSKPILQPIQYLGLKAWCTGWAGDREGTVYASFLGRPTAVNGIWAAFQSNKPLRITYDHLLYKRPKMEGAKYHAIRVRLPQSDWLHLVIIHTQATVHNLYDYDCYILNSSPEPPIQRFWAQWNNAVSLPALRTWAPKLWNLGQPYGVIFPCDAEGIYCWRLRAKPRNWIPVLQQIIEEEQPCPD